MKIMLEEGARMPERAHKQDAGLDLYSRIVDRLEDTDRGEKGFGSSGL